MALLDVPVAEEVSEVAEDGEDAVAHVGEHSHQQRRLLERLHEGLLVQTGIMGRILLLRNKKGTFSVTSKAEVQMKATFMLHRSPDSSINGVSTHFPVLI